jgi:hypothetical protein
MISVTYRMIMRYSVVREYTIAGRKVSSVLYFTSFPTTIPSFVALVCKLLLKRVLPTLGTYLGAEYSEFSRRSEILRI